MDSNVAARPRRLCWKWVMILTLWTAAPVLGQDFRGGIVGRINDTSGGRLPGATVTATNAATNVASTTATNGEGQLHDPLSAPGTYAVTVELPASRRSCATASRCASATG